jgi:hypothetical protein
MSEADEHHELLAEARALEQRRIEVTALAIEGNVADLLPEAWAKLNEHGRHMLVPVEFDTGLRETDGQAMSERECRNFVAWVGSLADMKRRHLAAEDPGNA